MSRLTANENAQAFKVLETDGYHAFIRVLIEMTTDEEQQNNDDYVAGFVAGMAAWSETAKYYMKNDIGRKNNE